MPEETSEAALPRGIVKRIPLREPVQLGEDETDQVTHLDFPKIKARHIRGIVGGALSAGQLLDIAGELGKVPAAVLNELGLADAKAITDYVLEVLGPFLQADTGSS